MKKYDFPGFGNKCYIMREYLNTITRTLISEEGQEARFTKIQECYDQMKEWYDTIDFDELEKEIVTEDRADFETLFLTRDILPRLEMAIGELIQFVRGNRYKLQKKDEEYKKMHGLISEIINADEYDGILFRARIMRLDKELETRSEPQSD